MPTMYIKNRRNSNKFKDFGSYQTLSLTEKSVLRNRLLFIYETLTVSNQKKKSTQKSLTPTFVYLIIKVMVRNTFIFLRKLI